MTQDVMERTDEVQTLGIGWLDNEHRELGRLLGEFARCIAQGGKMDKAHDLVARAVACGNAHFQHEEEVAAAAGFPGLDEEKFNHRSLRLKFTTLVGDTVTFKSRDPVTLGHLKEMRKMLDEHIAGPDKRLADYLLAAGYR